MITAAWILLTFVVVLWPAKLAGPLDGAPLDQPAEVLLVGVLLVWLAFARAQFLRQAPARWLVIVLLAWKAVTGLVLVQDGWCVRFATPQPIYRDGLQVPHTWDIRADWRSAVPQCAAIMTRDYAFFERFPVWFYNLVPADTGRQASPQELPPHVTLEMSLGGYLHAEAPGVLRLSTGEGMRLDGEVDGRPVSGPELSAGVSLDPGQHHVGLRGTLSGDKWMLGLHWNGAPLWAETVATTSSPSTLDRWLRPWGRAVPMLLVAALLAAGLASVVRRAGSAWALGCATVVSAVVAGAAVPGREAIMRGLPMLLVGPAVVEVPRRLRNMFGMAVLVAVPFLAIFAMAGARRAGTFSWYSTGDDWWTFQRFAYRIFLQGHWLEGGERTFWYQPLYRWIAGSLHMVFGDSSVGELFWDAGGALIGASFAFHVTRAFAGFRWGVGAAVVTLAVFTLGPGWYLFGRGLSEFTSAGFIYLAALCALRGRHGYWPAALSAGVLATLGLYTRLNNLPMALAVACFALPVRLPIADLPKPSAWMPRLSKPVLAGVLGAIALGLWLFTARTYFYTRVPSMLFGTTAGANSVWQPSDAAWEIPYKLLSSLLMLLTLNDPPRFDVRAVPVLAGFGAALLGVARVRPFHLLPMNVVLFCLAGVAGAFVARGTAYPGRFSTHLVPVTAALLMCVLSLAVSAVRRPRSAPRVPPRPGTT